MKHIHSIEIDRSSKEEILPDFAADFPYIATCAELDRYREPVIPWHWHRTVELFYMKSGTLEYTTPKGKWTFPAGSGCMVNANVLHSTRFRPSGDSNIQLLHMFDPVILAGEHGSRMETKYILPLTTAPEVEVIPLYPEDPAQAEILEAMKAAFSLEETDWGYEFQIRNALTEIWMKLFELARPAMGQNGKGRESDDTIKTLMIYIQEHYPEPISVAQLARIAHISKRACFRLFRDTLHMTPVEYIRSCRLQKACRMLLRTQEPVTRIAYCCGLGSSSYFSKTFREEFGCSPMEYRRCWHNRDNNGHE